MTGDGSDKVGSENLGSESEIEPDPKPRGKPDLVIFEILSRCNPMSHDLSRNNMEVDSWLYDEIPIPYR